MTDEPTADELELERYLDGTLDAESRREFEDRLAGDPSLLAGADMEDELLAGLRRTTGAVPDAAALLDGLEEEPAVTTTQTSAVERPTRRKATEWVLVASLFLVAGYLGWRNWPVDEPAYVFEPRPLTEIYAEVVDKGFEPGWVCENNGRFAGTFAGRQGRPLLLASLPAGTRMVGLSYLGGLSERTTALLARVEGEPVVVFVDRVAETGAEADSAPIDGLRIHRRLYADLVFIEVGPFAEPAVLPFLFEPDSELFDAEAFPGA